MHLDKTYIRAENQAAYACEYAYTGQSIDINLLLPGTHVTDLGEYKYIQRH